MVHEPTIKREQAFWLLKRMRTIRQLSERIIELYPTDVMETPVHLCIGQEAVSAGVCIHLRADDVLVPGHRTHGPALSKGLPLKKLVAELYGRTSGCSRGHGGSMHVFDPEHGIPGSSAIVGGSIAVAVGAGLGRKLAGSDAIGVAYFGDGATDAGVFWESLNFAALKEVPVLFVLEDNGLSNVMPKSEHMFADVARVAAEFMPVFHADGTDVLSVFEQAGRAVRLVRGDRKPAFLACPTKRWMQHQGVLEDDLACNPIDREKDCPIVKLEEFLLRTKLATPGEIAAAGEEIERELDEAFAFAEGSPFPDPRALEV